MAKITASIAANIAAESYQWYANGAPIIGATARKYEVKANDFANGPASFQVEVENNEGCTAISEAFTITSLQAETLDQSLTVYPNTAFQTVTVSFSGNWKGQSIKLELFSPTGQLLQQLQTPPIEEVTLNIEEYPKGTYLLRTTCGNKLAIRKIVKK